MSFALGFVPVILLLLGFPIFLVLLTAVTVALVFFMNVPLAALHQNLFGSVSAYALLSVPYFIYAGELMGRGSVALRVVVVPSWKRIFTVTRPAASPMRPSSSSSCCARPAS